MRDYKRGMHSVSGREGSSPPSCRLAPRSPVSKYVPKIVTAYFKEQGLPEPQYEYLFALKELGRKWRFDLAWPEHGKLFIEIQGGVFIQGRHNRGAAMLREWEKLNAAACLGWRGLFCQPMDLCMKKMVDTIKKAMGHEW